MQLRQSLRDELNLKKFSIVKLLSNLFLGSSIFALIILPVNYFSKSPKPDTTYTIFIWCVIFAIFCIFGYIRRVYLHKNFKNSFLILGFIITLSSVITLFINGTDAAISYILILVMIISSSIVLGVRSAKIFFILASFIVIAINIIHNTGIYVPIQENVLSNIGDTAMLVFFAGVVTYMCHIGYSEIEYSYEKAFGYAKKLESLNKLLNKKVELRTKQLEDSFEKQANSLHSAAVMGNITRPLLHDLANPISSLKGAFDILNRTEDDKEKSELLAMAHRATKQIERIISDSRSLIRGDNIISVFSPSEIVDLIISIVKSELDKNNIKVNINVDESVEIEGIASLFERVVINLIINAIEELSRFNKEREITITSETHKNKFVLYVKDTGNGISPENLEKIFNPDFSSKQDQGNLGLGLPFVKSVMEKQFHGRISVQSKVGEYTQFKLVFKIKNNESQKGSESKYKLPDPI